MPCTYTGSLEGDRAYAAEEDAKKLKKELNRATRLLCSIMKIHEKYKGTSLERVAAGQHIDGNKELQEWWQKHKVADAAKTKKKRKTSSSMR